MMIEKDEINLEALYLLEGNRLRFLEELSGVIANSLALTAVGIGSDIQDYKSDVIHEYLGAIDTLLQKAKTLCEQTISTYFQSKLPLENKENTVPVLPETENSQLETSPE